MGEVKFTPGPWKHGYGDGLGRFDDSGRSFDHGGCIVTEDEKTVIVGWGIGPDGEAEGVVSSEADAHLIAAAPLMYAELEKAYRYLAWADRLGVMSGIDDEEIGPITRVGRDIHDALAKARGDE